LNAPGNSAPHAATEMNFGLPSAASGRLARHGRPGPGATYLRTAINTCGIALPCGDRNEFRSTCRRGAGADAGCGRVRRNSFRHGLGEDMGRAKGCAEIHFGMGWGRTRGDRNKFRSTCRRGAGADAGRAKGCAEIHFGMGWGRTRGDRNKFRSTCRRGAGADAGRAKGCAEIHFGMGWGRTRGDRNKFRSTGRRGAGADAGRGRVRRNSFRHGLGEDKGRPRGCAEIYFGMGCEQKRGDRNKFRSPGRRGAGADAGCGRVRRNSFRHGLGEDMGRAKGCAEIHYGLGEDMGRPRGCAEIYFGMGCGQKRGDRNEFRSTGRRGLRAEMGCGRVRRNSFRHGLGEDMGRAKGCAEIHFGMGCEQKRGDRNKFRSTGRRGAGADAGCGRVRRNSFRHGL
jgi:hypothetical protein